eukprot:1194430-Prorocentrum_minimum.AAC.2
MSMRCSLDCMQRVLRFHTSFSTEFIPRSREVGQSWFTSVFTTAWACLYATWTVFKERPDVVRLYPTPHRLLPLSIRNRAFMDTWRWRVDLVICNGPGTCIPICFAAVLLRISGLAKGAIIFVESIARVDHLSLTGKILYSTRIASVFLVQWERLAARLPRARYIDRLILGNCSRQHRTALCRASSLGLIYDQLCPLAAAEAGEASPPYTDTPCDKVMGYLTSPSLKSRYAYISPLRSTYPTRLTLVLGVAPNDRIKAYSYVLRPAGGGQITRGYPTTR